MCKNKRCVNHVKFEELPRKHKLFTKRTRPIKISSLSDYALPGYCDGFGFGKRNESRPNDGRQVKVPASTWVDKGPWTAHATLLDVSPSAGQLLCFEQVQ
jgi:hypothetical protein